MVIAPMISSQFHAHPLAVVAAIAIIAVLIAIAAASRSPPQRRNGRRWEGRPPSQAATGYWNRPAEPKAAAQRGDITAKVLMTPWERMALAELIRTLPHGMHVCPQVRLADMIEIRVRDRYKSILYAIASKSVDFAIVDQTGAVILVIELNDKTHNQPDRVERDIFVRQTLDNVGIPLAVFKPNERIDVSRWLGRR